MQYTSVVFAIIRARGVSEPLGQLAVDSPTYKFTDHDRHLLTLIAQEFGRLIRDLKLWTWPDDPGPGWHLDKSGHLTCDPGH